VFLMRDGTKCADRLSNTEEKGGGGFVDEDSQYVACLMGRAAGVRGSCQET